MIGVVILVVWLLGVIPAARVFRGVLAEAMRVDDEVDTFDFWMEAILGLIAGMFWPLALPVALVGMKPKKTAREYEQEARQRDQHIRNLERELGIK